MIIIGAISPLYPTVNIGLKSGGLVGALVGLFVGLVVSYANIYGIKALDKFCTRWISSCVEQKRSAYLPNLVMGGLFFYIMISCCLGVIIVYGVLRATSSAI
jgi:hypothetical protein